MSERGESFRSAEEVLAAAQTEFQVDLKDRSAVMAKAQELNRTAQRTHDYVPGERLSELLNTYHRMSGQAEGTMDKAA